MHSKEIGREAGLTMQLPKRNRRVHDKAAYLAFLQITAEAVHLEDLIKNTTVDELAKYAVFRFSKDRTRAFI
jgi:hypothetical protein